LSFSICRFDALKDLDAAQFATRKLPNSLFFFLIGTICRRSRLCLGALAATVVL
jgi:hypothetical protein